MVRLNPAQPAPPPEAPEAPPPEASDSPLVAHLPGWMFLLAGMVLLGAALLMPAWRSSQLMQHQVMVMQAQAQQLDQQVQRYEQFSQAVASDDPVLLTRLAYYYLRLKPSGTTSLVNEHVISVGIEQADMMPVVEALLHQPLPRIGVDLPAWTQPPSRLARLTSGYNRYVLMLAGTLCLMAGLMPPSGAKPPTLPDPPNPRNPRNPRNPQNPRK